MSKAKATLTIYEEQDGQYNGPAGVTEITEIEVEIIGYSHNSEAFDAVKVRTKDGRSWWVRGDDLDNLTIDGEAINDLNIEIAMGW